MSQTVLVTGTGRPYALGFNLVKRYLEAGDRVFASIRRPSEALEALQKDYPDQLHILTMDSWIRTNPDNTEAPLDPYEHADALRLLFESKRHDKNGPVFVTHTGEAYPW